MAHPLGEQRNPTSGSRRRGLRAASFGVDATLYVGDDPLDGGDIRRVIGTVDDGGCVPPVRVEVGDRSLPDAPEAIAEAPVPGTDEFVVPRRSTTDSGRHLFDDGDAPYHLTVTGTEAYPTGVIRVIYSPAEAPAPVAYDEVKDQVPDAR